MIRPLSAPTSIRSLALVSTNLEIWHSTTYKTSHHAPQNPANLVCPIKAQATTVRTTDNRRDTRNHIRTTPQI